MLDGKCKNGTSNFNTPFVLARHRAHRLLDGHNALCIYVDYYSRTALSWPLIKNSGDKFVE